MLSRVVGFVVKIVNSLSLFLVVFIIRALIVLGYYKPIHPIWWIYVNYLYIRKISLFNFFFFLRFCIYIIIFMFFSMLISISFFLIFIIVLEDSFLNLSFYACNKSLFFFLIFMVCFLLLYEDEEFEKFFESNYDDWEEQWDEYHFEVLEDFENDPDGIFVDLIEDMSLEPELDDSDYYWMNANSLEEGDDRDDTEDSDLLIDEISSNLYFYESWYIYSTRFSKNLIKDKNKVYLNEFNYFNSDYLSDISLNNLTNIYKDTNFLLDLYKIETTNARVSDTLLLSLYIMDIDFHLYSSSSFNFSQFSLSSSKFNIFFNFSHSDVFYFNKNKLNENVIKSYETSYFFRYLIKKSNSLYLSYNEFDHQISNIEIVPFLRNISFRFKKKSVLNIEVLESPFIRDRENYFEELDLPGKFNESLQISEFNLFKLENFVGFLFQLLLQERANFDKSFSFFYFKNRLFSIFINKFIFFFFNSRFLKEVLYRRQLLFILNLLQYNKQRFPFLATNLFYENVFLNSIKSDFKDKYETVLSLSYNWNLIKNNHFNMEWFNDENIMFDIFVKKDLFSYSYNNSNNIVTEFNIRKKKLRESKLVNVNSFINLFFLKSFFVFEDIFFWFLFFPSSFLKKFSSPLNSFKSFIFLILKYNINDEINWMKQRNTFFPFFLHDLYYSRPSFYSESFSHSKFFKFAKSQYSNVFYSNVDSLNKVNSFVLLNEIFLGLGYYNVKLLNDKYFNNPNHVSLHYKFLTFSLLSKSILKYNKFLSITNQKNFNYKNNWNSFLNTSFFNDKLNLNEEEVFSLILNRIWDFEYVSNKEQFILEFSEDILEGYGSTIIAEDDGSVATDEFDLVWDWTVLNWNIIIDLYEDLDQFLFEDNLTASLESGTNYYSYVFSLALMFWCICKFHYFANYSSDIFKVLVPLYRTSRYNDVFRFFLTDYVGSGRNRLLGSNFLGEPKALFQHGNTLADEYLRTGYYPLKPRLRPKELRHLYKWLSVFNFKETYLKTQLHLTNGIFSFRRSNVFFKKNSLFWMKYARLNRSLYDDFDGYKDKSIFLKNLNKHELKLEDLIFQDFIREMKKTFKKDKSHLLPKKKSKKKKRKFVFRYGTRHDILYFANSRIKDILYFRDAISNINGAYNRGTIYGNILDFYKNTEFVQTDFKFTKQLQRSSLEDLVKLSTHAYREGMRLFLFGSAGTEFFNQKIYDNERLSDFEKDFFYKRFLKKIKPLNRYGFYASNRKFFVTQPILGDPVLFENLIIRLFLKRLRKSHRFRGNPFMTTAEFFEIYRRRKIKKRKPIRQPDIDYTSKMRGSIKSLGLHAFLLDLNYRNIHNNKQSGIFNDNIASSHHSGIYGSLLRNFIQYRFIVRRNMLLAINRVPYIFNLLDKMGLKERDFLLGQMGILRYIFSFLNAFMGEEFLYFNSPKNFKYNSLSFKSKKFFSWYKSVFRSPYNKSPFINQRYNKSAADYNLTFENSTKLWNFDKDIEKFFFKTNLYDELEFYLRVLTREYEYLDDYSLWYDLYEGEELMKKYYTMFLMPYFLKDKLDSFNDPSEARSTLFRIFGNVRNSPKRGPTWALILKLFNKDSKNVYNYKSIKKWINPSSKIVNRKFDNYFLNSLFQSVGLYNQNNILSSLPNPSFEKKYRNIRNDMEEVHLFEGAPFMFRLPQVLFFRNKRDYSFDSFKFKSYSEKGYRQFRKSNYKKFYYENFFNLVRGHVDYMEGESGYNRLPHFGLELVLPSTQLYFLDDFASFGSTSYRWYYGSVGDDLFSDTRRSLTNSTSIIWPYILRNALGLPKGDMPYLKLSSFGGFTPSAKSNAYGYSFYGYRTRPNLNSDSFEDMGFEDLNYPPEEEALGLIFARTFARFITSTFVPTYYKIFNYFVDNEFLISDFGGHLEQRPTWLRKISFKTHNYLDEFNNNFLNNEFGKSNTFSDVKDNFDMPNKYYWKLRVMNWIYPSVLKRNNDKSLLNYRNKYIDSQYLYQFKSFFIPFSSFNNSYVRAGGSVLILIFFYLVLYYFIWVPWMYFFFSINMYFDVDYGKEEPTMDDIKQDLEEIDEDEKSDYELVPSSGELPDTGSRHSYIWSSEIADLIFSYYDNLVFDYTALMEPPYFFYLNSRELSFYGSSIFNIARNEFIDLENVAIYEPTNNMAYSLLSIMDFSEQLFIDTGYKGIKPQYSILFTEFLSLLTGFEVDDGDIREEYLDLAFLDDKIYRRFPTSEQYFKYISEGNNVGNNFYLKERDKDFNLPNFEFTKETKYNNFYNLGRFNFNDPFKMSSLRTTVWMSLQHLLNGIESLGINFQIYQQNDNWFYLLPNEYKSNKILFNELLSFFPKGVFGYIERNKLSTYDLQYKNGEMLLPIYFRFFRSETDYNFQNMGSFNNYFIHFLESIGASFLKKISSTQNPLEISNYVTLHNSTLVQPANFDGVVSHEMLFGVLYMFQQFIYEHSSLIYFNKIDDYILESFAYEINELHSYELLSFLSHECKYTWSDWLFFFEESTDWTLYFDVNNLIEIEDDFNLSYDEFAVLKAEADKEIDEEEEIQFPKIKAQVRLENELIKKELIKKGFSEEAVHLYLIHIRQKPYWLYDDFIESLILIIDEDEFPKEGPSFPDYDTSFSFYFNNFKNNSFTLSNNYSNLVLFNIFSTNYLQEFDQNQNLINDIFLQFLTMQFVDFNLVFDKFQKYNITGQAIQLRCSEIDTIQNNYYFSIFLSKNYFNSFNFFKYNKFYGFYCVSLNKLNLFKLIKIFLFIIILICLIL